MTSQERERKVQRFERLCIQLEGCTGIELATIQLELEGQPPGPERDWMLGQVRSELQKRSWPTL